MNLDRFDEDPEWDALLAQAWQTMSDRFALTSARDWIIWAVVIGWAARLEFLAVSVLWVDDREPGSPLRYKPRMTLGQAKDQIRARGLLDATTIETLKQVNRLRNGLAHRGATYGVPSLVANPARGEYCGRHVFTEVEGLRQLDQDARAASLAMRVWVREHEGGERP